MRAARTFVARTVRAMKLLARDGRIPKPLRWVAGLGLLPVPGPVDEALLIFVAPVFYVFYREPLHAAWDRAQDPSPANPVV